MKKYFPITNSKDVTHLKIHVSYELGGYSYATSRSSKRGYYAYITPLKIENHGTYNTESYAMFSGFKTLVKEVTRKSKKAENEAISLVFDDIEHIKSMIKNQFSDKFEIEWIEVEV